jgi:1-acyl-sn-glycerol-3-phosphate acyltransferase
VHSIYRLKTSSVENIPEEGPALLVCNHQSLADALVITAALEDGQLVCIFPEGQLTRDGEIGPFRPGVTRIVERTPVPVIPMALQEQFPESFNSHFHCALQV